MKYELIKKPEEGYWLDDVPSKDWWIGIKAELSPENQTDFSGDRFYIVWTGQCEPFLKRELVENRPDLWKRIDE